MSDDDDALTDDEAIAMLWPSDGIRKIAQDAMLRRLDAMVEARFKTHLDQLFAQSKATMDEHLAKLKVEFDRVAERLESVKKDGSLMALEKQIEALGTTGTLGRLKEIENSIESLWDKTQELQRMQFQTMGMAYHKKNHWDGDHREMRDMFYDKGNA